MEWPTGFRCPIYACAEHVPCPHPSDSWTDHRPMFVIIGYLVALGCIFGGYILHGGNIEVVLHALPIEMMVIDHVDSAPTDN